MAEKKISKKEMFGMLLEIGEVAENEMRNSGIAVSLVHLGEPKEQWFESYSFYPKHGYKEYEPRYMKKSLNRQQSK